jgi:hypothetical protein
MSTLRQVFESPVAGLALYFIGGYKVGQLRTTVLAFLANGSGISTARFPPKSWVAYHLFGALNARGWIHQFNDKLSALFAAKLELPSAVKVARASRS